MILDENSVDLSKFDVSPRYALAPLQDGGSIAYAMTHEGTLLRECESTAKAVQDTMKSKGVLFRLIHKGKGWRFRWEWCNSALGKRLLIAAGLDWNELRVHFPDHSFNPYIEIFRRLLDKQPNIEEFLYIKVLTDDEKRNLLEELENLVKALRKAGGSKDFQSKINRARKRCHKKHNLSVQYVKKIFRLRGSRHLVVRIDLGYAPDVDHAPARRTSIGYKEAKSDMAKFERHLRKTLPLTGFLASLEYGLFKGHHYHVVILINGHLKNDDVGIAQKLGEHWQNVITEGQGRYFNCNAKSYLRSGIGMIDHSDLQKIQALCTIVIPYLTKVDFWLRYEKGKTFFRGHMPVGEPVKRRPRRDAQEVAPLQSGLKSALVSELDVRMIFDPPDDSARQSLSHLNA